jgi:hypothetical protein
LRGAHARAAKKSHYEWQSYESTESVSQVSPFPSDSLNLYAG